jgi:hypothetical protein
MSGSGLKYVPSWGEHPLPYSLAAPADVRRASNAQGNGGAFGHEFSKISPLTPMDTSGRYVEAPREFTFKAPVLLHIDSSLRDTDAYSNEAYFRVRLPFPLRQVISMEVLNVSFANLDPVPPGRYVLLLNGLYDGSRFVPQSHVNAGIYSAVGDVTVANHAMAKIHYNTAADKDQLWRRSELRQIKYFNPPEAQIQYLELMLATRDGAPVVFDSGVADQSWTVTLEIVCKN